METFSALLALSEGKPPATGGLPSQRPVTRSSDVFFGQRMNKRMIKKLRRRWFETPSCQLWRHCNEKHHQTPSSEIFVIIVKIIINFLNVKSDPVWIYVFFSMKHMHVPIIIASIPYRMGGKNSLSTLEWLIHCSLMTPYSDIDLGQHWLR